MGRPPTWRYPTNDQTFDDFKEINDKTENFREKRPDSSVRKNQGLYWDTGVCKNNDHLGRGLQNGSECVLMNRDSQ